MGKSLEEKGIALKKKQEENIKDELSGDNLINKDKPETKNDTKSIEDLSVSDAKLNENKTKDESCDKKQPIIKSKANTDPEKSVKPSIEKGQETSGAKKSEKGESLKEENESKE